MLYRYWGGDLKLTSDGLTLVLFAPGGQNARRGRGGSRGRGRFAVRRDGPVKFEKDFDFESANAQFNKEDIDREFQNKLKLKGNIHFFIFIGFDFLRGKSFHALNSTEVE